MKEKLKELTNNKFFHIIVLVVIVMILLFIVGIVVLKYNVEGETNMPFHLSKISIISSSEGKDKESTDSKWAFDLYQSNDIYIYIDKNEEYDKTEAIKEIRIENMNIESANRENVKIYRPDSQDEKQIFKNEDENIVENLIYEGALESDLKNLKISNQGGLVAFRCSNNNIVEYKSNDEEIIHTQLLKNAGITEEILKMSLKFDIVIKLENQKEYKANVSLELPVNGVVEQGTASKEITDMSDIIFKRVNT